MAYRMGKLLFGAFGGRDKASNCVPDNTSPSSDVTNPSERIGANLEAVTSLDGIEKKYAAGHVFSDVANNRLANLLSGRLGAAALKYRRSGTLYRVHFSKQILVTVAPLTRSGRCSLPFVVERYANADESREDAKFLLSAEFFDDAGNVLQAIRDGNVGIAGHAQIVEVEARTGTYDSCDLIAPPRATQVLLSFMTVDAIDEIVLISDFTICDKLPAVSPAKWKTLGTFSPLDLRRECRAILPVCPDTDFVVQLSASSLDADGEPAEANEKALVMDVSFFDDKGKRIGGRYKGMARSDRFANYTYVPSVGRPDAFRSVILQIPPDGYWLRLRIVPWVGQIRLNAPLLYGTFEADTAQVFTEIDSESTDMLLAAEKVAAKQGRISLRREVLRSIYQKAGGDQVGKRLKVVSGLLRELDAHWVPHLPVKAAASTQPRPSQGIRICHLHKVAYPYENSGGAIRNLNIVQQQKTQGMDPYVVLPLFSPCDAEDHGFSTRVHNDVPYFEFKWPKKSTSLPPDRTLEYNTLLTYSVVRAVGADVIHAASGFRGYELALQGIALREKLRIPLIYEVRSFHEHTWGPSTKENLEAEYTRLRMQKEDFCMQSADHVITISEAMRQLLIERGVSRNRIDVVPNGVDADVFFRSKASGVIARERHGLVGTFVIGYISNMSQREGHDVLIQAVKRVIDSGIDAKCLLVGDGPERNRLEQLAASLGIRDQVVFPGVIDHTAIHEYYRAIDLFVVPRRRDFASDYVTPLKPFEAMALGVPIIVSDRPALREIVGNSERGMLFRAESVDSLASALTDSIINPEHRLKLANAAKEWILRERTWKRTCSAYREIYAKAISQFALVAPPAHRVGSAGL